MNDVLKALDAENERLLHDSSRSPQDKRVSAATLFSCVNSLNFVLLGHERVISLSRKSCGRIR